MSSTIAGTKTDDGKDRNEQSQDRVTESRRRSTQDRFVGPFSNDPGRLRGPRYRRSM